MRDPKIWTLMALALLLACGSVLTAFLGHEATWPLVVVLGTGGSVIVVALLLFVNRSDSNAPQRKRILRVVRDEDDEE